MAKLYDLYKEKQSILRRSGLLDYGKQLNDINLRLAEELKSMEQENK
ncbi:hypothetical protein ACLHDG_09030 [Sulfurovum sp. CS9]